MSRPWNRVRLYNLAHSSAVSFLIGFTAIGSLYLGFRLARYYVVVRPALREQHRLLKQEELSKEQDERQAELLRLQQDAEQIKS